MLHLIHDDSRLPVRVGDKVNTFRGEPAVVNGWIPPPRHFGSTGRVVLSIAGNAPFEYYPSVIDCHWVEKVKCPSPA